MTATIDDDDLYVCWWVVACSCAAFFAPFE
jgi:hypothetical protein